MSDAPTDPAGEIAKLRALLAEREAALAAREAGLARAHQREAKLTAATASN